ncbi:hypothetical protein CEP80_04085 [Jonesia denitrificans]|nr:hypothetical protein CEP80_04085 [Jonesia denitrificans]
MLLIGDYELVYQVVRSRFEEILTNEDYRVQLYSGVILAAHGDESCRQAFNVASNQKKAGALHCFMAQHRLAASEIKRFSRPKHGLDILERLDESMARAAVCGKISEGDCLAMESVTANLRALALMGMREFEAAKREVVRGRSLVPGEDLDKVKRGELARYTAQQNINITQLLVAADDGNKAVKVLEENTEFCETHCLEYLSEAKSALAYAQFLQSDYENAICTAEAAINRIVHEASPERLRSAREIIIASYAELGMMEQAEHQLEAVDIDPLGLTVSREYY